MNNVDKAAIAVFLLYAFIFFFLIHFGLQIVDESQYPTIAYRLIRGDRLILDEWHISQFSALLQYIPLRVFTLLTGSVEGVILLYRNLYAFSQLSCSVFIYSRLRGYGYYALVACALFCGYAPYGILSLSYNTMALQALALCFVIFFFCRRNPFTLFFCGVLLACAVIAEPGMALLYALFTVICAVCFLRGRKGTVPGNAENLFSGAWVGVTAGVAVSAAAVTIPCVAVCGLKDMIAAFPQLFNDPEHIYSLGNNSALVPKSTEWFLRAFPLPVLIAFALLIAAALFKRKSTYRYLIGTLTSIVTAFTVLYSFTMHFSKLDDSCFSYTYRFFPLIPASAVFYILTQKKDSRLLGAYAAGIVSSLLVDVSSDGSLAMFEAITVIPAVLMAGVFFEELNREKDAGTTGKKNKHKKKRIQSVSTALICLAVLYFSVPTAEAAWQGVNLTTYLIMNSVGRLSELNVKTEEGPYKGIILSKHTSSNYAQVIEDLRYIAENTDAPVYVSDRFCLCYLFPGIDCAAYSTWYINDTVDKQIYYWETHPEKVPEYIYVPLVDAFLWEKAEAPDEEIAKDLRALEEYFTFTKIEGEAGWILKVTDCRIPRKGASR
ncbi:MAG: hypothetical protein IJK89_07415 [Clostridia bacterium]|nr:hypothetical protein [Clostridia bacterium]